MTVLERMESSLRHSSSRVDHRDSSVEFKDYGLVWIVGSILVNVELASHHVDDHWSNGVTYLKTQCI